MVHFARVFRDSWIVEEINICIACTMMSQKICFCDRLLKVMKVVYERRVNLKL